MTSPFEGFSYFPKSEEKKMRTGVKTRTMMEYEAENCKKNISFYKDQIRKDSKNNQFYTEQVKHMENKLEELKNYINFLQMVEIQDNNP